MCVAPTKTAAATVDFFYGLGNVSCESCPLPSIRSKPSTRSNTPLSVARLDRASSVTNGTVVMVGPPRIRQHRAGEMCQISPEMMPTTSYNESSNWCGATDPNKPCEPKGSTCWSSRKEETDGFTSSNANFSFEHKKATELQEMPYSTMLQSYSGDGYILKNVSELLKREPTRQAQGNELYQFAHSRLNLDDFMQSGWLSTSTTAIFHDFTLFSAGANAYVTVRPADDMQMLLITCCTPLTFSGVSIEE